MYIYTTWGTNIVAVRPLEKQPCDSGNGAGIERTWVHVSFQLFKEEKLIAKTSSYLKKCGLIWVQKLLDVQKGGRRSCLLRNETDQGLEQNVLNYLFMISGEDAAF